MGRATPGAIGNKQPPASSQGRTVLPRRALEALRGKIPTRGWPWSQEAEQRLWAWQGYRHRCCPQGVSPLPVSLLLLRGFPPVLGLSLPVSLSPLRPEEHGPGLEGTCLVRTGQCPCMSPTPEPRQLPRCPSSPHRPRSPSGAGSWSRAKSPGWGCSRGSVGGLGGDPRAPGSILGCCRRSPHCPSPGLGPWDSHPLFPLPLLRAVGIPDPARFLSPLVHVASAGRARAA